MAERFQVEVAAFRALALDVVELELRLPDASRLPGAGPGAHIDVAFGNGLVRQYSLTNADGRATLESYRIAVGLDRGTSRGGSRFIHEHIRLHCSLVISPPRNLFAIDESHGRLLFVAGGIGITPLYAMSRWAAANDLPWRLVYAARSESRAAYVDELRSFGDRHVRFHFDDQESGRPLDVPALVAGAAIDEALYCCGPTSLMEAVKQAAAAWHPGRTRFESFTSAPDTGTERAGGFVLRLVRSALSTHVTAGETVLDAIERLGIVHPYSCRQGLCGTCEVRVVSGEPEHRDSILSAAERARGSRFLPCVSRCRGETLEIDL